MKTPILFLIYNRPDLTKRAFNIIRKAAPEKFFVAADGPNRLLSLDREKCEEARKIAAHIDWNCEINTLFREKNLGLEKAVSSAINWFFDNVEEGIILEDDCIPNNSFFRFCEEMLERYRQDNRIMVVSGNNFGFKRKSSQDSYSFSRYALIWGWATWRRAWKHYEASMKTWPKFNQTGWLHGILGNASAEKHWARIFQKSYSGKANSWATKWMFSCWEQGGLTIIPGENLVGNIGYGRDSTHTVYEDDFKADFPKKELPFPLKHPLEVIGDPVLDRQIQQNCFEQNIGVTLKIIFMKKIPKMINWFKNSPSRLYRKK